MTIEVEPLVFADGRSYRCFSYSSFDGEHRYRVEIRVMETTWRRSIAFRVWVTRPLPLGINGFSLADKLAVVGRSRVWRELGENVYRVSYSHDEEPYVLYAEREDFNATLASEAAPIVKWKPLPMPVRRRTLPTRVFA